METLSYALVWCLALLIAVPMPIIAQENVRPIRKDGRQGVFPA